MKLTPCSRVRLEQFLSSSRNPPTFYGAQSLIEFFTRACHLHYLGWELSSLMLSCPTSLRSSLILHLFLGFPSGLLPSHICTKPSVHVYSDVWENISINFVGFCRSVAEDSILLGYNDMPLGIQFPIFQDSGFSIKCSNVQEQDTFVSDNETTLLSRNVR